MDEVGERDHRRGRMDNHNVQVTAEDWNMISMYQIKETSAFHMNAKIAILCDERDAAIEERDRAFAEKKLALNERNVAIQQHNAAVSERDNALRERDNAIAALQFQESTMNALLKDGACGLKRVTYTKNNCSYGIQSSHSSMEGCINDAFSVTAIPTEVAKLDKVKRSKENKDAPTKLSKLSKKVKRINNNMNRHMTENSLRAGWDSQDSSTLNQVHFDKSTMPVPICSCTGVPRQCYKWGHGGWQSSCCTTSLSVYPLPQLPNKKHARMGGRKMSANVYSRLLTRLAAAGLDLSTPLDLKNYWAKHGTNRYITIK